MGYSRSPKLLKGALIQFSAPLLIPIPNLIIFQYNPESMTRNLTPWSPSGASGSEKDPKVANALIQPYDPQETFDLKLELDAADQMEEGNPLALFGVGTRLAAMEMLAYPPGDSALSGLLSGSLSISAGGISASGTAAVATKAERKTVPIVLFFWGPGRIVPVRITKFSVEEQAFSPALYPIRATVNIGLQIIDAVALKDDDTAIGKIAKACYTFTLAQKQTLATANLANSVESIMGMLPF